MAVIVTRAAAEAADWVAQLQAHGLPAESLPLMAILPPLDPSPLLRAWQGLQRYHAVMLVSRNAVAHFFAEKPLKSQAERASDAIKNAAPEFVTPAGTAADTTGGTRYWATGPGTARALRSHGVPANQIDSPGYDAPQFDSEALWALVQARVHPGMRVLVVRGQDEATSQTGRLWLAEQLTEAGAQVHSVLAYRRGAPTLTPAQGLRLHTAASDGSVWLFSSSQAIAHLQQLAPAQSWHQAKAVVSHPRIALAARAAGFAVVCVSRPTLAALVESIKSLHD